MEWGVLVWCGEAIYSLYIDEPERADMITLTLKNIKRQNCQCYLLTPHYSPNPALKQGISFLLTVFVSLAQ